MSLNLPRALKAIAVGLFVVAIGSVGCVEVTYRAGLRGVPAFPEPPAARLTPVVEHQVWAYLDGDTIQQMQPIYPWHILLWVARAAVGRPSQHPGFNISGTVASEHLQSLGQTKRGFTSDVRGIALIVWVSRHFSAPDAASYWAARAKGARGTIGLDEASRVLFGQPAAALSLPQFALVIAVSWKPDVNDPWCHPARAIEARNRALLHFVQAGAISAEEQQRAAKEPLAVVGRECQGAG
jgi:hypothetical protein